MSTVGPKFTGAPQFAARGRGGYNDLEPTRTDSNTSIAGKKQGGKKINLPSIKKRLANDMFQKS